MQIDIEKSKYLGGDVEHTHLVKGLDFSLLERTRQETGVAPDVTDEQLEEYVGPLFFKFDALALSTLMLN